MSDKSDESGKDCNEFNETDDNFVWQDYLEMTNTEEVPHILFAHVEQSLQSSLQPGMMLEVPDKNNQKKYWPAVIKMSCGPLLSLSYIAPERSPEFWCDIGKVDVHPLGWCEQQQQTDPSCSVALEPPESLAQQHKDVDWQLFASRETAGKQSVPAELLAGEGYTAIERIKQGMRIEVEDDENPLIHWVATIIENVGGRLLLRYDSPDSSLKDFWLFYTSPRLFRLGWADDKGSPWQYKPPANAKLPATDDEWASILETARLEAELLPPPPDLFQEDIEINLKHKFEIGMKLEAVHPVNQVEICPATVIALFETGHLLVQLDDRKEEQKSARLCKSDDPYIFPPGWCKKHQLHLTHPSGWTSKQEDFDWNEYLQSCKNALAAPETCFVKMESAQDMGFDTGLKLEAVDPDSPNKICAASINKSLEHLLWLNLESHDSFKLTHIVSTQSTEIFPVGWCGSNSYPLKPPLNYQAISPDNERNEQKNQSHQEVSQKSSWCPKIYFNHRCFTGPFLSKGKLAQLPRSVGPGPVTLVLREVLSMLISVAYKSRQVLKELQCEGTLPPGRHIEVLKAKLKSAVYRANVAIVASADEVPGFCQEVCSKLQSCPNLFGTESYSDSCPVGCSALSKSRFTNYWSKHKRHQNSSADPLRVPKKRGRKKLLTKCKDTANASQQDDGADKSENNKPDEEEMESDECESRPESVASKRKYKKKMLPQFEMRTRGAKLPNFALQMASWTWGKEGYIPAKKNRRISSDTTNVSSYSVKKSEKGTKKRGRPPLNKNAVSTTKLSKARLSSKINTNPMHWSVEDVKKYLQGTPDCGVIAERLAEEDIDGHAFMLLNLPTIQENLQIQLGAAIKLCQHIERVKFAYFSDFNN